MIVREKRLKQEFPLVSVGIISYNQKEYLRKCIDSCLSQDYPNFEIVVADDCSSDGTQEMLRDFNTKYPGKFVLRLAEKNQGITENSNICLNACSGTFIAMVGGDDLLLPKKISKQADFLQRNKDVCLCGTYTRLIDSEGVQKRIKKDFKKKLNPYYNVGDLIESGNGLIPVVSYMFRAQAIPPEKFESRIHIASDALFMTRLSSKGKIYVLKEVLTAYRVHESHARKKGYELDKALTSAFQEYYYPEWIPSIFIKKSKLYLNYSYVAFTQGNTKLGYNMLKASMLYKLSIRALIVYCFAKLGLIRLLIKIVNFSR